MPLPSSIFRTYDIRAIADTELTDDNVALIAHAFACKLKRLGQDHVVLGRDGRLSSDRIYRALSHGLLQAGIQVTDIGCVPTPVLYFACKVLPDLNSGIMITASHNPAPYNGFKALLNDRVLSSDEISELYTLATQPMEKPKAPGQLTIDETIQETYTEALCQNIRLTDRQRLVIDYSNGVTAGIAPALFERLGCDVIHLYDTIDGRFPNHAPEPTQPKNLVDLIHAVKHHEAALGIAFDGDGDRMIAVTGEGEIIFPDRLLMLFAQDVLAKVPGQPVVFDVKCSHRLPALVKEAGGIPIISATGHTLIKRLAKEKKAILAGEMSGHFIFYDRWYDFDDGIYAAARLLDIIDQAHCSLTQLNAQLPETHATPEIQVPIKAADAPSILAQLEQMTFSNATLSHIDGIRADFPDGFALVRASNTTPCLVLRFEADTPARLQTIQANFKAQFSALCPDLSLPF